MRLLILLSFFCCFSARSQNEGMNWYFGKKAGLNFSTSPPTILTNGMLVTQEGCSTMSDPNGNLLFYTDGDTIWNSTHNIMANGTGLFGHNSSTQSALILKQPGNNNIYYVFTAGVQNNNTGTCYSIVNMNLAAGLGSVTVKNAPLFANSTEKLTSTRHSNGTDIWIITHDYGSNQFRVHLLTASGVTGTPVVSSSGLPLNYPMMYLGQVKCSPTGLKIGCANYNTSTGGGPIGNFELHDFNPSTGVVSNPVVLTTAYNAYGCEFSADGSKFYGVCFLTNVPLYQWDLSAPTTSAVINSAFGWPINGGASAQLAPDGKIYIAGGSSANLTVIHNPNIGGSGMNCVVNGQSLAPREAVLGLPGFFIKRVKVVVNVNSIINCNSATLSVPSPTGIAMSNYTINSYSWNFGDPTTGSSNVSTLSNPTHTFSSAGTYTIKVIVSSNSSQDTLSHVLNIQNIIPSLNLLGTSNACIGETLTYTVTGATTYTWSTGSTNSTATLTSNSVSTQTLSVTGIGTSSLCPTSKSKVVHFTVCDGMDNLDLDSEIKLFPNPTYTDLTVTFSRQFGINSISIKNSLGQTIRKEDLQIKDSKISVPTSDLDNGIYLIQFETSGGIMTKQFIKH